MCSLFTQGQGIRAISIVEAREYPSQVLCIFHLSRVSARMHPRMCSPNQALENTYQHVGNLLTLKVETFVRAPEVPRREYYKGELRMREEKKSRVRVVPSFPWKLSILGISPGSSPLCSFQGSKDQGVPRKLSE